MHSKKHKVSFLYFDYTDSGKIEFRREKQRYTVNPIELVLSEENYYLIGCMDKYKNIINFRVDRMTSVREENQEIIDTECINDFDINEYKKQTFNMYGGESERVKILVHNDLTNIITDKFGEKIFMKKEDKQHFSVSVDVQLSPTFYSWCFLFGNKLKVISPEKVVSLLKERLQELQKCYNL